MVKNPTVAEIKEELKVKFNELIFRRMHEHLDRLGEKNDVTHEPLVCYCQGLADGVSLRMGEKSKDKAKDIESLLNQLCDEIIQNFKAKSL